MKNKKHDKPSDFSRRDFVRVAGLGAGAASIPGVVQPEDLARSGAPTKKETEKPTRNEPATKDQIPYSEDQLFRRGPQLSYSGRNLDEIAFPLGGVGTGSITLGGWGQLRDWEIMNRPAKGFVSPRSFFMLKTRLAGSPPVTKVLQGPVQGGYVGAGHSATRSFYKDDLGHGLPHFTGCKFTGHFPFATVSLEDPDVPLQVTLDAFNPFVPLTDKDRCIPVAILSYTFENVSDQPVQATVYGNVTNIVGSEEKEDRINRIQQEKGITGLYLTTQKPDPKSPRHGSMVLATTCPRASVWPRWKQNLHLLEFWKATALSDDFPAGQEGESNTGTIAADFTVDANGKATVTFFLAWYFPTFERYWEITTEDQLRQGHKLIGGESEEKATWKNYYATLWDDAWDVVRYTASNLSRLEKETTLFHDTLFESTLPVHVLDAVSSQLSTLNTTTCLRLEDGTFYGFEGSSDTAGCCIGSCSHVWYYAQAVAYLFPDLQRSMTDAHFANSFHDDGMMTFRMPLPLGRKFDNSYHPAADGQLGLILQVYRDWLISGNDDWLRRVWPKTKKALEFSWKYWDADRDGVMEGMKHNTYNFQFHGPETMSGSLYLTALRASAEIADYMGEPDKASEYRQLAERGSKWTDANLFNGEYYEQLVNLNARDAWPESFREMSLMHGNDERFTDWPKWQLGKGCLIDHMIGQWYARMLDLGNLYQEDNLKKAVYSIFKYNWKPSLQDHPTFLRTFALNDEAGLVMCTWPRGERPGNGVYIGGPDEVMTGFEYMVATHLVYEGMIKEGLAVVMGIRNRYRGDRRNPWDEYECGHHYSRAMDSYALVTGLSGFKYRAAEKTIGFSPKMFRNDFRCFFSVASGWGLYSQTFHDDKAEHNLEVRYGSVDVDRFELPAANAERVGLDVRLDGHQVPFETSSTEDTVAIV